MTVETRARVVSPARLTLRLAARLLFDDGAMTVDTAVQAAAEVQTGTKRKPEQMVTQAMRPLLDCGAAVRVADTYYAPSMADLAAWVADGFEAREDDGNAVDPVIPAPRTEYQRAA